MLHYHPTPRLDDSEPSLSSKTLFQHIGAIGFCFGGMAVLDMARHNMGVKSVVSFHGSLTPIPNDTNTENIGTKILIAHGHADRGIPPSDVTLPFGTFAKVILCR